ncbi:MAG TPA: bifunctional DNA primase/polymerase, partial [Acidimicrobiia bacterium]
MPEQQTSLEVLLDAARRWYDAGCCVVPSHQDRSKRPHTSWSKYQTDRPSWLQVQQWLDSGDYDGIGVITGRVSGNLELIEIEGHAIADGAVDKLMASAEQHQCADLLRRVIAGCSGRSAGGGLHLYVKVTDEPALPNTRLAYDQTRKILAETRGEGGFAIVAPTPARTGHEPGSKYEFLTRGPEHIAEVTGEERDVLHLLMTIALDDRPVSVEPEQVERVAVERGGDAPGDRFAAATSWDDILVPAGWVRVFTGD